MILMMQGAQRYILENKVPVPCSDENQWREFMRNKDNILIARDEIGPYTVVTVFLGFNHGTASKPKFFQTTCFGTDSARPKYSKDCSWAMLQHRGKIACAEGLIRFFKEKEAGIDRSFSCLDYEVHPPNEIHFILESEEAAKKAMPFNKKHWERRENRVIFCVTARIICDRNSDETY
ncbi:hypothetical protein D0962_15350 [Leptolyngbyaceae cyanobacterium CCMR0082]|uniref:Uncharacterized protein n=1 Tax=Adonisia turfae CCMR0082 TaxID=2304604 RepID=A0A6M0S6P7_9CYAN|nr:hypothetical protein [Adonisia turfae]NEZ64149.1 hypothetical protein [Adonisia turfae CCMR0082]